ncbi:ABC transporter substrate-binding protein [Gryllotalpicola protaetiae]|uniref:Carbohydrate ABC transporter substrate-binding protein n=1 Tax=Gryllotalpicola protaetiae TaxID=2419771 RepID=A0A387BUI2_9MICO|nr:ABC transporter substrate-binding protein [Gryllotalpicola protaetiae]AYG04716.1 carbohydrate ABC transporter substrate-binding protein [Gryllotalpicola protaetiae]
MQHPAATAFNRRTLLKGAGIGALGLFAAPVLAACTGTPSGGGTSASKTLTFGSNASDDVPKRAYAAFVDAFQKKSGDTVKVNTTDHNSFQDKISNYLQGAPDDAFTWFAGYRMQYYSKKGLTADIDDVWDKIGDNYSEGLAKASTGEDGKKYFVPNYNYPWGYFYKKSLWQSKGYQVPKTLDDFEALCKQMKTDGLIPIGFADKDAWPACGTFDYIDMRTNGYQFHMDLCAHKESWNQKKVQDVFDTWKLLLPYQDPAALGMTWQDAAQKLGKGESGMFLLGSFVTQQFTDPATLADIDFFPFPSIAVEGQDAIEAPIDGLMLSKKGGQNQAARDLLAFMGTGAGQLAYWKVDGSNLMTAKDADTSGYTDFSKKLAGVIADAKSVSQFFDRDALPAMATNVLEPAMQSFIKDGTVDLSNIESQAKTQYASE